MKNAVKLLTILLFAPTVAHADYGAMTLFQMTLRADWILIGQITASDKNNHQIAVDRRFRSVQTMDVLWFRTTGGRDYPAIHQSWQSGQRIMLFAQDETDALDPLGLLDEGAMLIWNGDVLVPSLAGYGPSAKAISLPDGVITAVAIPVDLFSSALSGFLKCYSTDPSGRGLRDLCTPAALMAYKSNSWLAGYFHAQAQHLIRKDR